MLLSSSSGAIKKRTLNLVTYNLLIDFITEFLKNGVTMRGFHSSHQSKSIMKYGVAESDMISWTAWHRACEEFMSNIFEINKKEALSCLTCGPRPPILVFDWISMGIQQDLHTLEFAQIFAVMLVKINTLTSICANIYENFCASLDLRFNLRKSKRTLRFALLFVQI